VTLPIVGKNRVQLYRLSTVSVLPRQYSVFKNQHRTL